jgi:predicted LPLAT superfamily acyltransferase
VIEAAIRVDATAEREAALQQALGQYAALLETYVRRRPDLYRNWHT